MASKLEHQIQTEKVIVRKDGGMKPADTRCRAKVGSGRCKNEITFDEEGEYWSKLCKDHTAEDKKARAEGTARVERV
jgi:hypothetical protein